MSDFKSCPCKGNTLDKFIQPIILTILAQETIHGYMIIEKIAQTPMFKEQNLMLQVYIVILNLWKNET